VSHGRGHAPRRAAGGRAARRLAAAGAVAAAAALAAACGPEGPRPLRLWTDSYEFRVTADPSPPRAREPIRYRVVVLDRKTRQVIDGGEGQIFAKSRDGATTYDSFEPAQEAGTYSARVTFITAGDWNMNLRFRRDSTALLEKPTDDWVQAVRGARPISERPVQ
jgi:hypothetical protein